jgi:hypothetical protein
LFSLKSEIRHKFLQWLNAFYIILTTPTGKASTANIQSRREVSFLSCLSCSWFPLPLVRRLERSVSTQIPKKTAWMTCRETATGISQ